LRKKNPKKCALIKDSSPNPLEEKKTPKKCTLLKDLSPDPLEKKNPKKRYLNKGPFTSHLEVAMKTGLGSTLNFNIVFLSQKSCTFPKGDVGIT
jgi:hypothetical protein